MLNAKFSPGALVDLEYTVQILQYMYGRDYPALQTPRIHVALEELVRAGIIESTIAEELVEAYDFFRKLINGLRMLRGTAQDLFLPQVNSDEYGHLARRIGYEFSDGLRPAQQLSIDFQTVTATIRRFVENYLGRDWVPGKLSGNIADLVLSDNPPDDVRRAVLSGSGITQTERAYINLKTLAGDGKRRQLFARLSVLARDILEHTPDPDMALNNWERFENSIADVENHYRELLSQPKRFEILMQIFSSSQFLADTLIKYPEFYNWVTDPERINRLRSRRDMAGDLERNSEEDDVEWGRFVRRFRKREILRIAARDICLGVPVEDIVQELSSCAETILQAALTRVSEGRASKGFTILAFGKLGGEELNYSSDLDLLGVYSAAPGTDGETTENLCTGWLEKTRSLLSDYTDEGNVYRIDFRLRPYGRAGNLVFSESALLHYYKESASSWEVQALLKIRSVAGDLKLGQQVCEALQGYIKKSHIREEVIGSIRTLRREAVRKSARSLLGGQDIKSGEGGIRDIEFLVQGYQLVFNSRFPSILTGNTLKALERIGTVHLIPEDVIESLKKDYMLLRRVEHFLQILEDRQTHTLPTGAAERRGLAQRISPASEDPEIFFTSLQQVMDRCHHAFETHLLGLLDN